MGESTNQRRGKMAPKRIPRGRRRSGFQKFGLNASIPLEIGFIVRAFGLFLALRINFEMPEGTNFLKKHKSQSWKSMVWVIGAIFPASRETGREKKKNDTEKSLLCTRCHVGFKGSLAKVTNTQTRAFVYIFLRPFGPKVNRSLGRRVSLFRSRFRSRFITLFFFCLIS